MLESYSIFENLLIFSSGLFMLLWTMHQWQIHRLNFNTPETQRTPPLSVIICARNADETLTEYLPKVLNQDYPEFEVIVVNDCSYDSTEQVIEEYQKIFPQLRSTTIKEDDYYKHGKKFAVLVGIKAARFEHLVFTDADCYPHSEKWLKHIAASYNQGNEVVLGYGAYQKQKGFINLLIRWDTFYNALFFLSHCQKSKAISGVGRNMGYLKSRFYKEKGFSNHYHLLSGDDDLFVNYAASHTKMGVYAASESITYSKPKATFWEWTLQKARHLTTSPLYSANSKLKLLYHFSLHYGFYLLLILMLCFKSLLLLGIAFWLLKSVLHFILLRQPTKKLLESDLGFTFLLLEPLWLVLLPWFKLHSLRFKSEFWMR